MADSAPASHSAHELPIHEPQPRVAIEDVRPSVDGGRFAVKRTQGDRLEVSADVFLDGHDLVAAVVRHRSKRDPHGAETPMEPLGNDRWRALVPLAEIGVHEFQIEAWPDRFGTWQAEIAKKHDAGQAVGSELLEGAERIRAAAARASGLERERLSRTAELVAAAGPEGERVRAALDPQLAARLFLLGDRSGATRSQPMHVRVDRERARFGAWYELFPRSAGADPARGATLREAAARLPEIAAMGFDIVYLPPIHPIGLAFRKGPNNALSAGPDDPGSPWAIGSEAGGHTAVHPELGTLDDFDRFVDAAREQGLEIALDIAFQCSPDHPWVREHPEWFRHRPDGSIKYAENPPKKYQDIYPFDFESPAWRPLWHALRDVGLFWAARGVRVFRVDNPHTKPFRFWEWWIAEIQREHPDAIFLSEAFTRPKVMRHLAKLGFTQSYTYFTWRNTKRELIEYFTELQDESLRDYFRPNLFANTPDILHEYLQVGGRAAHQVRLVLAATLGASYGIYGPLFERGEARAVPGTEEYQDSEKYQFHAWHRPDRERLADLSETITRVNRARRGHPALQQDLGLVFHAIDDEALIVYSKSVAEPADLVLVAVNLDPHRTHEGWVDLALERLGIPEDEPFQVEDVLSGERYLWQGRRNYVRLDPAVSSAHLFVVRRGLRTERDFDPSP